MEIGALFYRARGIEIKSGERRANIEKISQGFSAPRSIRIEFEED